MRAVKYEIEVPCPLKWRRVALEKTKRDVGYFPDKNKHYGQKDLREDEIALFVRKIVENM